MILEVLYHVTKEPWHPLYKMSVKNQPNEIPIDGMFEIEQDRDFIEMFGGGDFVAFSDEECIHKDYIIRANRGMTQKDITNKKNMKYKFYRIDE